MPRFLFRHALHNFFSLPLALIAFSPLIAHADLAEELAKRETEVAAAKNPFDKAKALLLHASVPVLSNDPVSRTDWEKAGKSLDEFFTILNKLSKAEKTGLLQNGTANKWRGQVAYALENYEGAVTFFDRAEAEGYL